MTAMMFLPVVEGLTAILTFCCIPRWLPMGSVFDKTLNEVREAIILSTLLLLLKHLAVILLLMSSRTGLFPKALNFTCDSQQVQITRTAKPL